MDTIALQNIQTMNNLNNYLFWIEQDLEKTSRNEYEEIWIIKRGDFGGIRHNDLVNRQNKFGNFSQCNRYDQNDYNTNNLDIRVERENTEREAGDKRRYDKQPGGRR